jgi:hypothetical protein
MALSNPDSPLTPGLYQSYFVADKIRPPNLRIAALDRVTLRHQYYRFPEGGKMKTFEVSFRYQDRTNASAGSTVKLVASSLPGAIAKATREFVKGLDRKQRFDMNKNGLEIKAVSVNSGGATKQVDGTAEPSS